MARQEPLAEPDGDGNRCEESHRRQQRSNVDRGELEPAVGCRGAPGAGPAPAEAPDVCGAAAPGPIPETDAEEPSEPEIPEDSEEPAGEGAEGADESPSAAGGDRGPEADRPDDPPATDKTE